jgi:predicted ribosome quality control (RQC) complex YloA/Tae2 family protein
MGTSLHDLLRAVICLGALATWALAAPQSTPESAAPTDKTSPAEKQAADARIEMARLVHDLDVLLEQTNSIQRTAETALRRAETTDAMLQSANLDVVARITGELREELKQMVEGVQQRALALRELRDRAAREVPAELPDALAPLLEHVAAAAKLPSLEQSEDALEKIEKELLGETLKGSPAAEQLLGFVRYRLADTIRQLANQKASAKGGDTEAEKMLNRARLKFEQVLATADNTTSAEGSSLHAVALRRVLQIEATMYVGYKRLSTQRPASSALRKAAEKHRQLANDVYEQLKRIHPKATLPSGERIVDAAFLDAQQLSR